MGVGVNEGDTPMAGPGTMTGATPLGSPETPAAMDQARRDRVLASDAARNQQVMAQQNQQKQVQSQILMDELTKLAAAEQVYQRPNPTAAQPAAPAQEQGELNPGVRDRLLSRQAATAKQQIAKPVSRPAQRQAPKQVGPTMQQPMPAPSQVAPPAPQPAPQMQQAPVPQPQINPGNTYGYQSVAPQSMEALMGPAPAQAPKQKGNFLGDLGQALMGQIPGLIQNYALMELSKPQGGKKDWRTGLTFGASAPGSNPMYQLMVQQMNDQRAARASEQAFSQEMAMKEFESMLGMNEDVNKTGLDLMLQQGKDASKFMMDLLNSNMLDTNAVNPDTLARIQNGDLDAMAEARQWLKPGVEDQLKELAFGIYQESMNDPTYQPTEDELNLLSLLGVSRSPNSAYARESNLISQEQAHQNALIQKGVQDAYNTRQKGISLGNSIALADYKAAQKMTEADKKAAEKATPDKPTYRKINGVDYQINGPGMDVIKFDGTSQYGTPVPWAVFTGAEQPTPVIEPPAEKPWWRKGLDFMFGGDDIIEGGDGTEDLTGGY